MISKYSEQILTTKMRNGQIQNDDERFLTQVFKELTVEEQLSKI